MGNAGSCYGNGYFTAHRHDMGGKSLHAEREYSALRRNNLEDERENRREHFRYRHVTLPNECLRLHYCHYYNNSLQEHGGDMAIGAYGIINRLLTLYVMIVLGLTMGMRRLSWL